MKKLILLAAILMFSACTDKKESPVKVEIKTPEVNAVEKELRTALRESLFIKAIDSTNNLSGLSFHKIAADSSGSVIIKADNENIVQFKAYTDAKFETESYSYTLIGLEPKTGFYCVEQNLWEDQKYFMIQKSDGLKYEIANEPVISTNGKWLFVKQNDCFRMFDDCQPGFTVYFLKSGKPESDFDAKLSNYYVDRGGWLPNGQLAICLKAIDGKDENEYYFEISPKGGFR